MARPDEMDDLDALIDNAVDTFFVESPEEGDPPPLYVGDPDPKTVAAPPPPKAEGSNLDEAMDSLFSTSFQQAFNEQAAPSASIASSGDADVDRAIDFAVDTLFVEEPEVSPPETTQLEVNDSEIILSFDDMPSPQPASKPQMKPPTPVSAKLPTSAPPSSMHEADYDAAMAQEIEQHLRSVYGEETAVPVSSAPRTAQKQITEPTSRSTARQQPSLTSVSKVQEQTTGSVEPPSVVTETTTKQAASPQSPMRKLQEAILTLEWEISKRSIAVLTAELKQIRIKFQDDVAVDFAAVAMKLVLEYVAQRMFRAHPESIRFLLEVTDLLDRNVGAIGGDPLTIFHRILTRYETFKSTVRKAEGFPDRKPPMLDELGIGDPSVFAKLVETQALMLIRASRSLAKTIDDSQDPENLIRSFRFLVNRSVNRILENTHKGGAKAKTGPSKRTNPPSQAVPLRQKNKP